MTAVQLLLPAGGRPWPTSAPPPRTAATSAPPGYHDGLARPCRRDLAEHGPGPDLEWAPVPVGDGATSALAGIAASGQASSRSGRAPARRACPARRAPPARRARPRAPGPTAWSTRPRRKVLAVRGHAPAAYGVQLGMVNDPGGFAALGRDQAGNGRLRQRGRYFLAARYRVRPRAGQRHRRDGDGGRNGHRHRLHRRPGRQQPYLALAPAGRPRGRCTSRAFPARPSPRSASMPSPSPGTSGSPSARPVGRRPSGRPPAGRGPAAPDERRRPAPRRPALPARPASPGAARSPPTGSSAPPVRGHVPGTYADAQKLTSVVHGPAGWLATGEAVSGTAQRPLLVTSADGRVWKALAPRTVVPALMGATAVAAQAAAGPAGYVVVGDETTSAGTFPAAWWSGGLRTWSRAGGPAGGTAGDDSGQLLGVTAGPSGYVAVGAQGISPAVWTSRNGRAWRGGHPHGARRSGQRQPAACGGPRAARRRARRGTLVDRRPDCLRRSLRERRPHVAARRAPLAAR